jgi:molybdate transport system regulatory protein
MGKRKPGSTDAAPASDRLSIRLDLVSGARIGPGKVAVLEEIARSGSISAAGRVLRISYRRTWELVEDLNRSLGTPVVETAAGGSGGGDPHARVPWWSDTVPLKWTALAARRTCRRSARP